MVFQCRDEGPARAPVRWTRGSGLALPPSTRDNNGRLEMPNIQPEHTGTYICEAVGYPATTPGARVSVYLKVEPCKSISNRPVYFLVSKTNQNQILTRTCASAISNLANCHTFINKLLLDRLVWPIGREFEIPGSTCLSSTQSSSRMWIVSFSRPITVKLKNAHAKKVCLKTKEKCPPKCMIGF